jgi:hypothetical protein
VSDQSLIFFSSFLFFPTASLQEKPFASFPSAETDGIAASRRKKEKRLGRTEAKRKEKKRVVLLRSLRERVTSQLRCDRKKL